MGSQTRLQGWRVHHDERWVGRGPPQLYIETEFLILTPKPAAFGGGLIGRYPQHFTRVVLWIIRIWASWVWAAGSRTPGLRALGTATPGISAINCAAPEANDLRAIFYRGQMHIGIKLVAGGIDPKLTVINAAALQGSGHQPAARQIRRAGTGAPGVPFARVQRRRLGEKSDGLIIHRKLVAGGMHFGQLLPIVQRAAPGKSAGKSVAPGTGVGQIIVWNAGLRMYAALHFVHPALGFFRRQAVRGADIFHDRPRLQRSERDAVHQDHAFQGFLPAFGRASLPGN